MFWPESDQSKIHQKSQLYQWAILQVHPNCLNLKDLGYVGQKSLNLWNSCKQELQLSPALQWRMLSGLLPRASSHVAVSGNQLAHHWIIASLLAQKITFRVVWFGSSVLILDWKRSCSSVALANTVSSSVWLYACSHFAMRSMGSGSRQADGLLRFHLPCSCLFSVSCAKVPLGPKYQAVRISVYKLRVKMGNLHTSHQSYLKEDFFWVGEQLHKKSPSPTAFESNTGGGCSSIASLICRPCLQAPKSNAIQCLQCPSFVYSVCSLLLAALSLSYSVVDTGFLAAEKHLQLRQRRERGRSSTRHGCKWWFAEHSLGIAEAKQIQNGTSSRPMSRCKMLSMLLGFGLLKIHLKNVLCPLLGSGQSSIPVCLVVLSVAWPVRSLSFSSIKQLTAKKGWKVHSM